MSLLSDDDWACAGRGARARKLKAAEKRSIRPWDPGERRGGR
jgi:hypothetical protein